MLLKWVEEHDCHHGAEMPTVCCSFSLVSVRSRWHAIPSDSAVIWEFWFYHGLFLCALCSEEEVVIACWHWAAGG